MTFEFVNSLNYSHMIVKGDEDVDYEAYGFKMICENRIEGLLSPKLTILNHEHLMYYDVFGKKNLIAYSGDHPINGELLMRFIKRLYKLADCLSEYLLGGDALLLSPENIYVDEKTGDFFFAAFPYGEGAFSEKLLKAAEFFLSRMPVKDIKGTEMGYKLYQSCINGNLSTKLLEEIVYMEIKEADVPEMSKDEEKAAGEDNTIKLENTEKREVLPGLKSWIKSLVEKIKKLFVKKKNKETAFEDELLLEDSRNNSFSDGIGLYGNGMEKELY